MYHTRLIAAVLLITAPFNSKAQVIFPGLEGQALLDALAQSYTPTNVLSYSQARDTLYGLIDNHNDSVTCVYSGHTLYLKPGEDPSTWLFMGGDNDGINCEHTYPQSMGAASGNPESNMHHLFPARSAVNTARDNFPFSEIPDEQATQWYYKNAVKTTAPTEQVELYSERKNGTFEPREDHKGNVARAMFYFYTIYRTEADAANPTYFTDQQQTLCEWHFLDPADSLEVLRTWHIAHYQDGLPNPFVTDCTTAARTYCQGTVGECPEPPVSSVLEEPLRSNTKSLTIVPNPSNGAFMLEGPEHAGKLSVTDLMGKLVFQMDWTPGQKIAQNSLPPGIYFIAIACDTAIFTGKAIVTE
ncbi:MAG: endonuclease [Saprospiraceae bacterium]|nr:endonuclease [Saprospiraceae bacterium]